MANAFQDKTVFITGASRGIGKTIGVKLASEGANIVIASKTTEPHPKLEGTIFTAAQEMVDAGGKALPLKVDIRFEEQVQHAMEAAVQEFGGIDIVINNASAIDIRGTDDLPMKSYDLMHQINSRGTFLCSKLAVPYLRKSENPHVLSLSPPLNMDPKWFARHPAYTLAKYGMSMYMMGLAEEYRADGIAFNGLWPRTLIATAAVQNLLGGDEMIRRSRSPQIVADAAAIIFGRDSKSCTGNFFIDEDLIKEAGVDLDQYGGEDLMDDLFL